MNRLSCSIPFAEKTRRFQFGRYLLPVLFFLPPAAWSQYAPPAGQPGSTAVHKDSSVIVNWANVVYHFERGAADIANGWGVLASYGSATAALGIAEGNSMDVVSLGDSGSITLSFPFPIMNGPGNDFAVFENSFSDEYLEFAHVEVSTDGVYFVRFPSVSLIHSNVQTGTYSNSETVHIHNLAGKFRQGYGTPFDLQDIADSAGINPDSIRFVRIVDVIGTVDPAFATFDSQGNIINDPYPTDFASGGFDLDGVAVIHENNIYASGREWETTPLRVFPNPCPGHFNIRFGDRVFDVKIYDAQGQLVWVKQGCCNGEFSPGLDPGIYFVEITRDNERNIEKIVVW